MNNFEFYKDEIKTTFAYRQYSSNYTSYVEDIANTLYKIWAKYHNEDISILDWLYEEHKESILDDVEREYLRNIIAPFRQNKKNHILIEKKSGGIDYKDEYIVITICGDFLNDPIKLPMFAKGTMYKEMELYMAYDLEDLDLWQ